SDDAPTGATLALILASIPVVFALRAAGTFLNAYYMAFAGMHVLEQVRAMVFKKIQFLPLSFFSKNNVGDLMSRVVGDTTVLQTAIITSVNSLIKEPATLISAISFLIYLSVTESEAIFMLIAIATVPACVLPIKVIGKKILKKAGQAQAQAGELNGILNENFSSTREVRAYSLEQKEIDRFSNACVAFFKYTLKTVKYNKILTPLIELVSAIAIVFTLYIAIVKNIQPEVIASILTALYMCYEPIKKLGAVSNSVRQAEASLDRLEYILHTEDTVPETQEPQPLPRISKDISFKNVNFSYDEEVVLKSVNVKIEAGEVIALVGPSGAGKSTFANLVPRFYDPIEGSILIDGVDIKDVLKSDLRGQVALVSQEAILFSDSIANNIRIGKPDATIEEIHEAARMANAHDFIEAQDDGYDTEVGERGSRLSGGQRQRVSIARAFLKDAPIIILDEPTSALDAESEHQIQAALETLSKGRTVLIIAHRFSTIQHADRILVFNEGEIIATGPHKELYPTNELYRSLYDKQAKTVHSE
ncbi:MAG: ABC transporter ATP-binding protein/permease, partial [Opitutales bacterium]|nr:ABC transporter ATP-binding protein/permease [Opitutales bacterium]